MRCGICQRELPDDPNELETIESCRYCDELFCSPECATDHEQQAHAPEVVIAAEDAEEERRA